MHKRKRLEQHATLFPLRPLSGEYSPVQEPNPHGPAMLRGSGDSQILLWKWSKSATFFGCSQSTPEHVLHRVQQGVLATSSSLHLGACELHMLSLSCLSLFVCCVGSR